MTDYEDKPELKAIDEAGRALWMLIDDHRRDGRMTADEFRRWELMMCVTDRLFAAIESQWRSR